MITTKESLRSKRTRANIVLYLSAFVAFVGVPLFFHTTLIHRAHLPIEEVQRKVATFADAARFQIPVYIDSASEELVLKTQEVVDSLLSEKKVGKSWSLILKAGERQSIDASKDYVVTFEPGASARSASEKYLLSATSKEIRVLTNPELASNENLAAHISQVLFSNVFKDELAAIETTLADSHTADTVFPYSPTYNVVFNLFVEDGRPVEWEIEKAVEFIQPIFSALGNFCKFKVSSQIQYYSKLHTEPVLNGEKNARVIPRNDLSTFVNYGEWNLNTHDIAPSINFLVFFPQRNDGNAPLLVENSKTNSFLIPQWGGVHVFNPGNSSRSGLAFELMETDLEPIFDIFASQLFELLGVPKGPLSPFLRVAAFNRVATLKNLKRALNNLSALLKISNSLKGISIPESTRANAVDSLEYYDKAVEKLSTNEYEASVTFAGQSVEKSDKAFFEKEMVQQAYFPSEHKLAVFLPLLGPICSIVFFGLLKYIRSGKGEKENEKKKKDV